MGKGGKDGKGPKGSKGSKGATLKGATLKGATPKPAIPTVPGAKRAKASVLTREALTSLQQDHEPMDEFLGPSEGIFGMGVFIPFHSNKQIINY